MANTKPEASQIRYTPVGGSEQTLKQTLDAFPASQTNYTGSIPGSVASPVSTEFNKVKRLQPGDFDLSWLIEKDGQNIVITGDSLSFNVYDFPGGSPTNEATSCWPGLMSWSFMLRDYIHRADPCFVHADQLDYQSSGGGALLSCNGGNAYLLPFNSRYTSFGGQASGVVSFLYNARNEQTGKIYLHCFNNPNGNDGLVDVYYSIFPYTTDVAAGTITTGGRTKFQQWEPFVHEISGAGIGADNAPIKISFKNWRNANGSPAVADRVLFMQGVATKYTPVYLTGHGSWQASDILADFTNRIGQYSPDLLIMILGANDRSYTTKETYAANLVSIINATRALKPYSKVVVLPTLRASNTGYAPNQTLNGSTMTEWNEYAKNAVLEAGAYWFDAYQLTSEVDPALWRYDNIHMTKYGNRLLFDGIVGRYFGAAYGSMEYYNPYDQANPPNVYNDQLPVVHGIKTVQFDNTLVQYTNYSTNDQWCAIESVVRVSPYTMRINLRYSTTLQAAHAARIQVPIVQHVGSSGIWVIARPSAIGQYYVDYFLLNQTANTLMTDLANANQIYSITF